MRLIAAFVLTMTLPGCAALSALQGEPERDVFELRPPITQPLKCGRGRLAELVIEPPKARGTLDTDRIMIRPNDLQTQYLPDARWGDTVPTTLQTLLVRSFSVYDVFTHVGRAPLGAAGDYAIISEVNDFNAEVAEDGGATVKLSVDAQMVREMNASVVSRGRFEATASAASTRTADLIPAFDAAGQDLVTQMTSWGLGAMGVTATRCR
ncbi:cholesterol transport system auxiliary component [Paracoccus halophilus]|uniref:Cholesterol transport system auxiliary component n=1 Tax=Paracoccus halophilus TaxID=376733 RepID=A0A099F5A5_9RHOB|nr:ABC-type transport auxiliary lipoprotein family protein [Paracoccus halophilus]KGJ05599.1 hypothetical protein IT41_05145 [Paracoccus halophilus]SFA47310.1 cholesterol transport system auxiliary component [Paracoccus halophilus]